MASKGFVNDEMLNEVITNLNTVKRNLEELVV